MIAMIFIRFFLLLAPFLSGVLLFLAFPGYDQAWVAWVALVPVFMATSGRSLKYGFLSWLVCGMVFNVGIFNWILEVPRYTLIHHTILALYLGSYMGVFGLVFCFISRRWGVATGFIGAPFVWVCLEYVRSNLWFMALPWGLLAHSQYQCPLIIQSASFTGAYGVSFLIVLVNSALALAILNRGVRGNLSVLLTTAGLIAMAVLYGQIILSRPLAAGKMKVAVVQGNIEQTIKWDPEYANQILQTYAELSRSASQDRPALIVWPETATPGFVLKHLALLKQMVTLIRSIKTHFLIGSAEYPKFTFTNIPFNPKKGGNTALFFSPNGKVIGQYLKIRLVPFSECVPYEGVIPWPHFIVPKGKKSFLIPGKEVILFDLEGTKFGTLICWETIFPGLFRKFVRNGADFMVNITNEAWFNQSAAPYQFLAMSVFRAVENRVSLVRAGNTGISCFINPNGRIIGRVQNNNKELFVKGYLTGEIPLSQNRTFYTSYGDVFIYISLVITLMLIILSLFRAKRVGVTG